MSERDIFIAAVQKDDPAERQAYLDAACAGRPGLRRQVEDLLRLAEGAGSFLERPAAESAATGASPAVADAAASTETPGAMLGPYKLVEPIGEGGMGAVWLAEQREPVRRLVALKVIRPGMDSRQVLARFEAERQALALMDHPHIAKVLDAGATAGGRPYFVMELVKGTPITKYCDDHKLTPKDRLELFVQVCQAVQHAHQKGVIHRDLKPSNVLVAPYDGRPVVKVIDFGVAKAAGQPLTDKTLVTGLGAVVGTPEYMSPEQAELNNADIDTRSDIYSLGVLLYELLTGTTPLTRKWLKEAALLEVLRVIREEEPPRPSTRLSTTAELPSIAAVRGLEPARLSKLVRGELDWIVMKALEKDRNRRYETANGFAADVERYLTGEPVQAVPPSAGYRLRKFARRNRRALATAPVLGAAVMVAVGGVAWSVGWANRDRAARQAAITGEAQAALKEAERWQADGRWPEALSAVRRAEGLLAAGGGDELRDRARELRRDVEMVLRLEQIRLAASVWKDNQFDFEGADRDYARAFADYGIDLDGLSADEAAARLRARAGVTAALVTAVDHWALVHHNRGGNQTRYAHLWAVAQAADPDPWLRRVRDAAKRGDAGTLAELAGSPEFARQPVESQLFLAGAFEARGQRAANHDTLRRAQFQHPDDLWVNIHLASVMNAAGRPDEAIGFFRAALALRPQSTAVLNDLGIRLKDLKRYDEAIAYLRRALELDPGHVYAQDNLGRTLEAQGKLDEAEVCFRRTLELDPINWARANQLGICLYKRGKVEEAEVYYRKAIELGPNEFFPRNNLGLCLERQGKLGEAVAAFRKAHDLNPKHAEALENLGNALCDQGRFDEAADAFQQEIALDPKRARAHTGLGDVWMLRHRPDEAATCYRAAIAANGKYAPPHGGLGNALLALGQVDEAVASLRKAVELDPGYAWGTRKLIDALREAARRKPDDSNLHYDLGTAYARLGRWKEAAAAFDRALELDSTNHEHWCLAAAAHAAAGDRDGYRRTCHGMLKRFAGLDGPQAAERTAKACLLLPDALDAADAELAQKLATRAVTGTEKDRYYGFFTMAKGLADYRAGRYADAVTWEERAHPNPNAVHWDAIKYAVQAMAYHRLGDADKGQEALARAQAILAKTPDPAKGQPFDAGNWHDWVHAQVLCREAEELLTGVKPRVAPERAPAPREK